MTSAVYYIVYETCTSDDLANVIDRAKACAHKWEKIVRRTRQKKKLHPHISPCWHGPPLVQQNILNTHIHQQEKILISMGHIN